MSPRPTSLEYHGQHEDARAAAKREQRHLDRAVDQEARTRSNMLALLQNPDPQPCDFKGCVT